MKITINSVECKTGKRGTEICLLCDSKNDVRDALTFCDEVKEDAKYDVEIKQHRKHRSLNANALCWKLCTEIANVLRTDKESVYLDMLKLYGQSDLVMITDKANPADYLKYYEECGETTSKGKRYIYYKAFKGSSEYDTREMTVLIDGIVGDAKSLGIQMFTAAEIEAAKARWGEF